MPAFWQLTLGVQIQAVMSEAPGHGVSVKVRPWTILLHVSDDMDLEAGGSGLWAGVWVYQAFLFAVYWMLVGMASSRDGGQNGGGDEPLAGLILDRSNRPWSLGHSSGDPLAVSLDVGLRNCF